MKHALGLILLLSAAPAFAAGQGPSFTEAQAERGHAAYTQRCAMCHGERLDDGDFGGAPLRGSWFRDHWGTGSVGALFGYVKTQMPPDNPGGLNDTTYADIVTFLLQRNGYAPGGAELPPDADAMEKMSLQK